MVMPSRETISFTTSGAGAASGSTGPLTGLIGSIRATGFDGTVDLVITSRGQAILTKTSIDADEYFYPRTPVHGVADGLAITGGYSPILLVGDALAFTIANGGAAQSGTIEINLVDT